MFNMRCSNRCTLSVSLMGVCLLAAVLNSVFAQIKQYPGRHNMIDVTKWMRPPYNLPAYRALIDSALGSGGTAQTPKVIYFPAGTYVMDDTIQMEGKTDLGCCTQFWGQGPGKTVIKLKDNAPGFNNPSNPKAFILTPPGNMSFRYCLYDLTVEIGTGNNGAMAVDYIANNRGSIENVHIVSADKNAFVGLEMTRYGPGPCLIKNVTIDGFAYGIRVGSGEYSPTFENITLLNQKTAGLRNQGNYIAVHHLISTNIVPAVSVASGTVLLVEADLKTPAGQTSANSAIDNQGGNIYLRNISSTGYASALKNRGSIVSGNKVEEFFSSQTFYSLFGDPKTTLKLPIKTAPEFHDNDTTQWVCIDDHMEYFSASLQLAINYAAANGKSTVYAPHRRAGQLAYSIYGSSVNIPPQIRKIQGFETRMAPIASGRVRLNITGNTTEPLIIECITFSNVTVHCQSNRPVVIKHCDIDSIVNSPGAGELYLEDMAPIVYLQHPQNVWMRQANPEDMGPTPRTRIVNNGGQMWILGIKTEGAGTIIETRGGGCTELLGSLLYPTGGPPAGSAEWQKPAFVVDEASATLMYTVHIYNGPWYQYDLKETRGGVTRYLCRSATTNCTQSVGAQWDIPLVVANKGCPVIGESVREPMSGRGTSTSTVLRYTIIPLEDFSKGVAIRNNFRGLVLYSAQGQRIWSFFCRNGSTNDILTGIPMHIRGNRIAIVQIYNQ